MTADILQFPSQRPTPLADTMRQLAYGFMLQTGQEATHILLPRRALRSEVKPFVEALCAEEPDAGKPPYVFDRIVNGDEDEPCEFAGLIIRMYDGEQVIVGRADAF